MRIVIAAPEPRSPTDLAEEISEPLSNVGYHVRLLEQYGALRLAGTEPVLGALKHYYVSGPLIQRSRKLVEAILAEDD